MENITIDASYINFSIDSKQHEIVMEAMITKASTPLYEGSYTSMLATMLLLLNLRSIHGVNNVFMDEFFSLLHKEMLPKGSKMPVNTYEAFKLIKTLGLSYDSIHACPNGCVTF
jgi:hypothetical protein